MKARLATGPALAAAALGMALAGAPARADGLRPELRIAAGQTLAVTGTPDDGGWALALGLRWPANGHLGFGVTVFADDLGANETRLRDPNDGTDLGAVVEDHRWTYGAAWTGDWQAWSGADWGLEGRGAFGYWREETDVRGRTQSAASAVGFTLGAALSRRLSGAHGIAAVARYHRVMSARDIESSRVDRYATVALEWRWDLTARR
jgi:hypothetical protein